MTKERILPANV